MRWRRFSHLVSTPLSSKRLLFGWLPSEVPYTFTARHAIRIRRLGTAGLGRWLCRGLRPLGGSTCWTGAFWNRRGSSKQLLLTVIETDEFRCLATGVLPINLQKTSDEKVLLLRALSMPVIRLMYRNGKPNIRGPLFLLLFCWICRRPSVIRLDCREFVKIPSFADRK